MRSSSRNNLEQILKLLDAAYGFQGWWPLEGRAGRPGYDGEGYRLERHEADPLTADERLEIAVGAVLTQNTAWENARRAIQSLKGRGLVSVEALRSAGPDTVADAVRASGYFNQKARKLGLISEFFARHGRDGRSEAPGREELLDVWGIGPETADSILLYAYGRPHFIADAYARRVFSRMGVIGGTPSYERLQTVFHDSLPGNADVYGEYHALLVRHGRRHCRKIPVCDGCPLRAVCVYGKG